MDDLENEGQTHCLEFKVIHIYCMTLLHSG